MADIAYNTNKLKYNTQVISWLNISNSDNVSLYTLEDIPAELSVQVVGTFGGTTVNIIGGLTEGSSNTLLQQIDTDPASTNIEDFFSIADRPLYIKPSLSGGSGSNVSVHLAVKYIFN